MQAKRALQIQGIFLFLKKDNFEKKTLNLLNNNPT